MAEPPSKPTTALVRIGEKPTTELLRIGEREVHFVMWSGIHADPAPSLRQIEEAVRVMARDCEERLRVDRQTLDARTVGDQLHRSLLSEAGQSASEIEAEEARRMKLSRHIAERRRGR